MPSFYIEVYGCQMNQADARTIASLLGEADWVEQKKPEGADAILLVTCAVREHAVQRVLGRSTELLRHRADNPSMVMGLLGCVAQYIAGNQNIGMSHLDLIVGPDNYRHLPQLLEQARARAIQIVDNTLKQGLDQVEWSSLPARRTTGDSILIEAAHNHGETYEDCTPDHEPGAVSAFVTVQRGCNRFCAYCVVPLVRGRERAVPPDAIVKQVEELVADGCCEITLLGQSVSAYRYEDTDFADLLRLVDQVPGLLRLRFTSPHPACFNDRLVDTIGQLPRVAHHLHLPVQSGSDTILRSMGRGHTASQYIELVEKLRARVPGISLTTDLLVGFPGETEADYQATIDLCKRVQFDTAFMFAYSPRKGTRSCERMTDDVPETEKQRRLAELIYLQENTSRQIMASQVGKTVQVLIEGESKRDPLLRTGRTGNFHKVVFRGKSKPGELVMVKIESSTPHTLKGIEAGDP